MEQWGGGSEPVVADSHHYNEEQDPDPHQMESRIRICIKVESRIRIRIKVKEGSGSASWVHNTGLKEVFSQRVELILNKDAQGKVFCYRN
jgi:hypothetical protein